MAFKKFSQFGRRNSSFISITPSQSFGFGADFLKQYELGSKKFVELYYDEEKAKIGFKFTDDKGKSAFTLIESKGTNSKSIVARSFFTTHLNDFDINKFKNRYKPEKAYDPEFGDLFTIKLQKKDNIE